MIMEEKHALRVQIFHDHGGSPGGESEMGHWSLSGEGLGCCGRQANLRALRIRRRRQLESKLAR